MTLENTLRDATRKIIAANEYEKAIEVKQSYETFDLKLSLWIEQDVKEQIAWHRDVNGIKDEEKLKAYEAGLRAGWRNARAAFALHGINFEKKDN